MLFNLALAAPAETTNYMIAGYAVIFSVIFIYVGSLYLRSRNLKREIDTLNEMEDSNR